MNFAKRNQPIFIIGLLTAIAFGVIIFVGQSADSGVSLKETIQNTFSVEERAPPSLPESNFQIDPEQESSNITQEQAPKSERPKANRPTIEIVFTEEEGFSPSSVQTGKGQVVRWINNSEREITIKELIKKHEEFSSGITIEPGGSYELTLYGRQLWTFKELESGKVGRMLIAGD